MRPAPQGGGSRWACRACRGIELAHDGHRSPAEVDDAIDGCDVLGGERLDGQQLRFGEQRSKRIVDCVAQVERGLSRGDQLLGCVLCSGACCRSSIHESRPSIARRARRS